MFATLHDSPPCLRQGDVIGDLFFPLARPASLRFMGIHSSGSGTNIELKPLVEKPQGSRREYLQVLTHGVIAHAAVMSQCCDLDKKHPKNSFCLCRLIPFERDRYKNVDALVENIDPWGVENPHFQFFYIGQVDGLEGEFLADYGLLTTLSWADYDFALGRKVHQLDDVSRNKFRVKAGSFWGRPPDEDVRAGLANPYGSVKRPVAPTLRERIRTFFHK
jgi:hypothetical protein